MIYEILSRGNGGVTKGVLGFMAASVVAYGIGQQPKGIKPRTLTPEWRAAEMKYRVAQNISER